MKLQTSVPLSKADRPINYDSQLLLLGSCFVEHMGQKLEYFKFRSLQNPFGILFHPLAIENLVIRAIDERPYTEKEIFFFNERWHCFDAHSDLSDIDKEKVLLKLNEGVKATREKLKVATHVVITLGTAWAYVHKETDATVANCHKIPQTMFTKEILSVHQIEKSLDRTIRSIRSINKKAHLIFTISPVRHLKDGFIENQQSKAHLMVALHAILNRTDLGLIGLFPSYEIQMDELRDYRFYGTDMVHPNTLGIDYIWEKFKYAWIDEKSYETMGKVAVVQKGREHLAFDPRSKAHQKFLESLRRKKAVLQEHYPFMHF